MTGADDLQIWIALSGQFTRDTVPIVRQRDPLDLGSRFNEFGPLGVRLIQGSIPEPDEKLAPVVSSGRKPSATPITGLGSSGTDRARHIADAGSMRNAVTARYRGGNFLPTHHFWKPLVSRGNTPL